MENSHREKSKEQEVYLLADEWNEASERAEHTDNAEFDSSLTPCRLTSDTDALRNVLYEVRDLRECTSALANGQRRPNHIAPPTYDGSSDVEEFLELFENIAGHNAWSDDEMVIRLKLAVIGPAQLGLQGQKYKELKKRLLAQNTISAENAMGLLKTLKLRPGDNIYHFSDKLQKLVSKAFPEMNPPAITKHVMREMMSMLPPSSQIAWLFKAQPPKDLEECVQRIHESNWGSERKINQLQHEEEEVLCKRMMNMLQTTQANMMKQQQDAMHSLVKQVAEGQRQMMEMLMLQQTRFPREGPKAEARKCYLCQQIGHLARNCPSKKDSNRQGNDGGQGN